MPDLLRAVPVTPPIPPVGRFHERVFLFPVRVYYEDTDCGGIVYNAAYIKFLERARTEFLRHCGVNQGELQELDGFTFVVRRLEVDYTAPAHLDDLLEVLTRIDRVGGASLTMIQLVRREETFIAAAKVKVGCVNTDGRPQRMPPFVKSALLPKVYRVAAEKP